jgi:molecular chaperone IbpA
MKGTLFPVDAFQKFMTDGRFVGFDRMFNDLSNLSGTMTNATYPPYNVAKIGEDNYQIDIAVSGFHLEDIHIELKNSILSVNGSQKTKTNSDDVQYLHRGLAYRDFILEYRLGEHVIVEGASLENGILKINLRREVPEEKKPRKIEIKTDIPAISENQAETKAA